MKKIVFVMVSIAFLAAGCANPAVKPAPQDEAQKEQPLLGGDRDEHGCIGSAGYSWCEVKQKCLRPWEEACEAQATSTPAGKLSEAEAKVIAEKTCIKGGEALSAGTYNDNSKTWWFDANLNATRPGCNPACVVSEETLQAEINWRCTGAIIPE
ncbi:MAG: hypothetical protein PHE24_03375 [Patescibacteria group bacterium]|nr:hypothetical protein [Patescibacteria group bacterium]